MLMSLFLFTCCFALGAYFLLNQPKFAGFPKGDRLNTIQKSANYADGEFQNLITTPKFTKNVSTFSILRDNLLNPKKRLVPEGPIPVVKTDLMNLDRMTNTVVWLGHSSYFIQLSGKRILLDPVFSDHAAPLSFLNKAFAGTNIYQADDMPEIDYLLISHDHWDHLDYATVAALKDKVNHVVCPLGVGAYFEDWGYEAEKIHEADWYDQVEFEDGFTVHVLPARHYSGRLLRQNKTLWAGFALASSTQRLFFSGDSGYGPHFAEIGRRFGDFDFVTLDCGQYDDRWAYIHMTPEEAAQAAQDLGARALVPAHVGRFAIANHPWDEPFKRLKEESHDKSYRLLTPKIGKPLALNDTHSQFSHWWEAEASNL